MAQPDFKNRMSAAPSVRQQRLIQVLKVQMSMKIYDDEWADEIDAELAKKTDSEKQAMLRAMWVILDSIGRRVLARTVQVAGQDFFDSPSGFSKRFNEALTEELTELGARGLAKVCLKQPELWPFSGNIKA